MVERTDEHSFRRRDDTMSIRYLKSAQSVLQFLLKFSLYSILNVFTVRYILNKITLIVIHYSLQQFCVKHFTRYWIRFSRKLSIMGMNLNIRILIIRMSNFQLQDHSLFFMVIYHLSDRKINI